MATVLLIGSGGREHAIAWKLSQSSKVSKIFVSPGNGGIFGVDKVQSIAAGSSNDEIVKCAQENNIDFVVVGPEQPLVDGLVDDLMKKGIRCFGPTKDAARLEGSKAFSKAFMVKHDIPTAVHKSFSDYEKAKAYVQSVSYKVVIKASGLAAGKGVLLPETKEEALDALKCVMVDKQFGAEACKEVVVEECLEGPEVSLLAFTDGESVVLMPGAQDHKRALNGDKGLNTGGMGAYAPAPVFTDALKKQVKKEIVQKAVDAAKQEGFPYRGVLYAGLMLTPNGPKVIEFNCRFGDPETQVVLPLLKSDLYEIMCACFDTTLNKLNVEWHSGAAATVVLASKGYPQSYPKGLTITGLDNEQENTVVFHAGTKKVGNELKTSGGRVLAVTARASSIRNALALSYKRVKTIHFDGVHYRTDIGWRALEEEAKNYFVVTPCQQKNIALLAAVGVLGFVLGRYLR